MRARKVAALNGFSSTGFAISSRNCRVPGVNAPPVTNTTRSARTGRSAFSRACKSTLVSSGIIRSHKNVEGGILGDSFETLLHASRRDDLVRRAKDAGHDAADHRFVVDDQDPASAAGVPVRLVAAGPKAGVRLGQRKKDGVDHRTDGALEPLSVPRMANAVGGLGVQPVRDGAPEGLVDVQHDEDGDLQSGHAIEDGHQRARSTGGRPDDDRPPRLPRATTPRASQRPRGRPTGPTGSPSDG